MASPDRFARLFGRWGFDEGIKEMHVFKYMLACNPTFA